MVCRGSKCSRHHSRRYVYPVVELARETVHELRLAHRKSRYRSYVFDFFLVLLLRVDLRVLFLNSLDYFKARFQRLK